MIKIYLADETTPAATVSMTVTVKAEGAVVWIVETFDNFSKTLLHLMLMEILLEFMVLNGV